MLVGWGGGSDGSLIDNSSFDEETRAAIAQFMGPDSLLGTALSAPGGALSGNVWNQRAVRAAEIPAANGVADARSIARLYASCIGEVDGVRLLTDTQLKQATTQLTSGPNVVLMGLDIQFGLGFMLRSSLMTLGGENSFGHFGAGGSMGWADPDAELAFGYVMNKMQMGLAGDTRTTNLVDACYDALKSSSLGRAQRHRDHRAGLPEAERLVQPHRARVVRGRVQHRTVAARRDGGRHDAGEAAGETAPAVRGLGADRADLGEAGRPHAFARHRDERAAVADADVAAELDGARPPRPGFRAGDEVGHLGDVGAVPSATCSGTGPGVISPSSTICTHGSSNVVVQSSGDVDRLADQERRLAGADERAQRVPVVGVGRVGQRPERRTRRAGSGGRGPWPRRTRPAGRRARATPGSRSGSTMTVHRREKLRGAAYEPPSSGRPVPDVHRHWPEMRPTRLLAPGDLRHGVLPVALRAPAEHEQVAARGGEVVLGAAVRRDPLVAPVPPPQQPRPARAERQDHDERVLGVAHVAVAVERLAVVAVSVPDEREAVEGHAVLRLHRARASRAARDAGPVARRGTRATTRGSSTQRS